MSKEQETTKHFIHGDLLELKPSIKMAEVYEIVGFKPEKPAIHDHTPVSAVEMFFQEDDKTGFYHAGLEVAIPRYAERKEVLLPTILDNVDAAKAALLQFNKDIATATMRPVPAVRRGGYEVRSTYKPV